MIFGAAGIGDGLWRTFGQRIIELFYRKTHFRYDFGFGRKDVRSVCKYYLEPQTKVLLEAIIQKNGLKKKTGRETVRAIMVWLQREYPSRIYYMFDKGDRWNTPQETMHSFLERKKIIDDNPGVSVYVLKQRKEWLLSLPTDCDDFCILIYNLCRTLKIPAKDLRVCFMKTMGEWHLNIMYFHKGVPYAVEGTYYPSMALAAFGRTSYFNVSINHHTKGRVNLYWYIKWLWNEHTVRYNGRTNTRLLREQTRR